MDSRLIWGEQDLVPAYRVGTLICDDRDEMLPPSSLSDANSGSADTIIDPLGGISSPFPSERFDGTGLEVRDIWRLFDCFD